MKSSEPGLVNTKTTILFSSTIFLFGIIFWNGFTIAMEATNTEAFCISCHEMKFSVYTEYQETAHSKNKSGVIATCPDCHVPNEFGPKLLRKVLATKDVYHWLLGTIDNKEKFEAKRLDMAKAVWSYMKESDSRECRTCHSFKDMDFVEQDRSASKKHKLAELRSNTCIDCHKGIAHELPDYDEDELLTQFRQ